MCAANKVVPKSCSEKTRRDGSEESETRRKILKMGVGAHGSKKKVSLLGSRRRSMESLQKRIQSLQSLLQRRIQEELVGRLQSLLQSLLPPEHRFGLTRLPTAGADRAPMFRSHQGSLANDQEEPYLEQEDQLQHDHEEPDLEQGEQLQLQQEEHHPHQPEDQDHQEPEDQVRRRGPDVAAFEVGSLLCLAASVARSALHPSSQQELLPMGKASAATPSPF